jgi:hypothetical protein
MLRAGALVAPGFRRLAACATDSSCTERTIQTREANLTLVFCECTRFFPYAEGTGGTGCFFRISLMVDALTLGVPKSVRFWWIRTTSWLPGVSPRCWLYHLRLGTVRRSLPSDSLWSAGKNNSVSPTSSIISR